MGNQLQTNIVSIGICFVMVITMVWVVHHIFRKDFYIEKYSNIDSAEILINFVKSIGCGIAVFLSYSLYSNESISMINDIVDVLSSIAYLITAMDCTTYVLNSVGVLIFKKINK